MNDEEVSMSRARLRWMALSMVVAAGCLNADYPSPSGFRCSAPPQSICPSGERCIADRCWPPGQGPDLAFDAVDMATRAVRFYESFDAPDIDLNSWTKVNSDTTLFSITQDDSGPPRHGARSLHVKQLPFMVSPPGPRLSLTTSRAFPADHIFVRFYVRFAAGFPLTLLNGGLVAVGQPPSPQQSEQTAVLNVNPGTWSFNGSWADYVSHKSNAGRPTSVWTCVEWEIDTGQDGGAGSTQLWLDDKEPPVSFNPPASMSLKPGGAMTGLVLIDQCCDTDTTANKSANVELWIDELKVDTQRIHCDP
jgi:hypothetical protein